MSREMIKYEQRALAPLSHFQTPSNVKELETIAGFMVRSGFFKDVKDVAQAMMKIIAGAELGLGPVQSQKVIYFVEGTPSFAGNFIAAQIKRNPRYDYRVRRSDNQACELEFYERNEEDELELRGVASFTIEEAKQAGLLKKWNWRAYPSDMLFNRALTRGARRYCPDAFGVLPIYTPEELGDATIVEGEITEELEAEATETAPVPDEERPDIEFDEEVLEIGTNEEPAEGEVAEGPAAEEPKESAVEGAIEDLKQELEPFGETIKVTVEEITEEPEKDSRPWSDTSISLQEARNVLYAIAVNDWGYEDIEAVRATIMDAKDANGQPIWAGKSNPIPDHAELDRIADYLIANAPTPREDMPEAA